MLLIIFLRHSKRSGNCKHEQNSNYLMVLPISFSWKRKKMCIKAWNARVPWDFFIHLSSSRYLADCIEFFSSHFRLIFMFVGQTSCDEEGRRNIQQCREIKTTDKYNNYRVESCWTSVGEEDEWKGHERRVVMKVIVSVGFVPQSLEKPIKISLSNCSQN